MTDTEVKRLIQSAVQSFSSGDLTGNALFFFKTLGYNTDRQSPLSPKTFDSFKDSFLEGNQNFKEDKAQVKDWKSVDLLFQLTSEELFSKGKVKWEGEDKETVMETYLFFALELAKPDYTRSTLAQITREINKPFSMPVMVLFKHGCHLTLSVINRRLNKKDDRKDVLEKVTLIKDIAIAAPHRAHIEILSDLSFKELQRVHKVSGFVDLHNAWRKTLDTKELNKRFYRDLSNWYFWALREVNFPGGTDATDRGSLFKEEERLKEHNAKNLIRLLTRLLFVWFVKEKNLIPDTLFDEAYIRDHLIDGFEPRKKSSFSEKTKESKYYRAILQNLFFATLNQTVGKREFRKFGQHMNVTTLMRYETYFKNPAAFIRLVEETVPFMNGGLFECLDSPDPLAKGKKGGDVILYEDGFSDRKENPLCVPDYIFFGTGEHADLSEELGSKKQKDVTVSGLIQILKSYKFTVTENTPIEEDVALDPELLGRVFENLLASYNPETKTTARKQTGSFYTPREIVNYMVDESLKAHLAGKLASEADMAPADAEANLELLLGYNDEEDHPFNERQTTVLIKAIDACKILDPACGSGAFPMGILHKLAHILHKIDPQNKRWKERQMEKVDSLIEDAGHINDSAIRDKIIADLESSKKDIEDSFANNELDYGRKLFLIENCIYGVDIQPIATQISKLRFFISLIVDQKTDKTKDNFGIRPLPNLETKFVAANTLIGIEKPDKQMGLFEDPAIKDLEKKLKDVRHRIFSAKTPARKRKLREEDQNLREEMGSRLEKCGWANETARRLAAWEPYNQNATSLFFDPEWMFGIADGFDVVIGNPPYIQLQKDGGKLANDYKNCGYKSFERTGDIYALFYENGINLLANGGHLCFITSKKWMRSGYGKGLRKCFNCYDPLLLVDLGPGIFETATVDTNILIIRKGSNNRRLAGVTLTVEAQNGALSEFIHKHKNTLPEMREDAWFIGNQVEQSLKAKIERIGKPLKEWDLNIYFGLKTGLNEAFIIDTATRDRLVDEDPKSVEILKPVLRGRDIKRYGYDWAGFWIIASGFDIDVPEKYPSVFRHLNQFEEKAKKRDDQGKNWWNLRSCAYYSEFEKEKVVWIELVDDGRFSYVEPDMYTEATTFLMTFIKPKYLVGVLNSKVINWFFATICASSGVGTNRWKKIYVEQLPIPPITSSSQNIVGEIECLVDNILSVKKQNSSADTSLSEREIDRLVYDLYGLTEEEIAIVEGKS